MYLLTQIFISFVSTLWFLGIVKTEIHVVVLFVSNSFTKYVSVHKSSNLACVDELNSNVNPYPYYFLFTQFFCNHIFNPHSTC